MRHEVQREERARNETRAHIRRIHIQTRKKEKKAQPLIVTNWPNNIDAGERTTIAEYTLPGFAHVKGIKMGLHN